MQLNGFWAAMSVLGASLAAQAACDCPNVVNLGGTGYHEGRWFTLGASVADEKGNETYKRSLLFDSVTEFVLSPRYSAPIRRVVVCAHPSAANPERKLCISPLVDGLEQSAVEFGSIVQGESTAYETVSFDFRPDAGVDAVRICLSGGGSVSWRLAKLVVFYGDRGADEDALLLDLAQQLPTPQNLRIAALDSDNHALTLSADPVARATGYRFVLEKLTGQPRTEVCEGFAGGDDKTPALSDGWNWGETNEVSFGIYKSNGYVDAKTSSDGRALQIVPAKAKAALAEIVSPLVSERISEVSFVCKATSSNLTDRVSVYGRNSQDDAWTSLAEAPVTVTTSMAWITNAVPQDMSVRQVKFAFAAGPNSSANCVLDTLRIAYGGNEERTEVVPGGQVMTEPTCTFDGLEGDGRYAYRVRAVWQDGDGTAYRDSSWTDEQRFEMAWASVSVEPPTGVDWDVDGSKMTVRWNAVAGADHYLVTVALTDDPDHPVVQNAKATGTSLAVTIPAAGEYSVQVAAVSQGGLRTAVSEATVGDVGVGTLASVALKAVERQVVEASWSKAPLAEGYQAKLVKVGGTAETVEYRWPTDETGRCVLPDGWTSSSEGWNNPAYDNTWTSGGLSYPVLSRNGWYLESGDCGKPITKISCAYKCGGSSKAANTLLGVYKKAANGDWQCVTRLSTSTSLTTFKTTFSPDDDIRQLRFAADGVVDFEDVNLHLGKLTLVYGTEERKDVESVRVSETKVSFRNLDPNGRYEVVVVPLPSEGEALGATSPAIDLSQEKFRLMGAFPLSQVTGGRYDEDFTSLTSTPARVNASSKVETRALDLDYWQLNQGAGAAETAIYSSKTNLTTGGVYVLSDDKREPASFRLGTLATGTYGCTVGIALKNDTEMSLTVANLSFKTVQRTFRANPRSYVFEWLVTDGATGVDTEGDWHAVDIGMTAPYTAGDPQATDEYVRSIVIGEAAHLPGKLQPGHVLILRWRHEKGASGPAMGIDDVRVEMSGLQKGFGVILL